MSLSVSLISCSLVSFPLLSCPTKGGGIYWGQGALGPSQIWRSPRQDKLLLCKPLGQPCHHSSLLWLFPPGPHLFLHRTLLEHLLWGRRELGVRRGENTMSALKKRIPSPHLQALDRGSANFFYKRPDGKMFWLWEPCGLLQLFNSSTVMVKQP